jgi:hypothetical protein
MSILRDGQTPTQSGHDLRALSPADSEAVSLFIRFLAARRHCDLAAGQRAQRDLRERHRLSVCPLGKPERGARR